MAPNSSEKEPGPIAAELDRAKEKISCRAYREADEILSSLEVSPDAPHYARLRHLAGLSKSRQGKHEAALEELDALGEAWREDSELIGLYGRLHMDLYDREGKKEDLERSWRAYDDGYRTFAGKAREAHEVWLESGGDEEREAWVDLVGRAYYLGINSATKAALLDRPEAEEVAREVLELIGELEAAGEAGDEWAAATKAEAHLILGEVERAAELYREAVAGGWTRLGSHSSTWLQARRLMSKKGVPKGLQTKVWQAFQHLTDVGPEASMLEPAFRRLRAYAFDPSLARRLETAVVNEVTLEVPWEKLGWYEPVGDRGEAATTHDPRDRPSEGAARLVPGPVGEYLEIVDFDPASGCFYEPVNLDDPLLLATDGLTPSEGDPRFHQQMVYGVAMSVIAHFERALGRKVLWSPQADAERSEDPESTFVRRLRVYPHALREANAYYSPDRKALLFGYFEADTSNPDIVPQARVFTCLSHDVVAHEMSHALLDGIHPRFAEGSNVDAHALHEAFADIVALLQHFSHPGVLRQEIARTRGNLATEGMLGELAQEFGRAIGRVGALRSAIGSRDPKTNEWKPTAPSKDALDATHEPHSRGAILVAAVFDAFLTIYDLRTRDLIRIATHGSGILEPGALHPDLVERLAREASKTATHVLRMCIRALDYCPPVDITFGDYLRALITADVDLVPDDRLGYRLAIIQAFHRRGIYPDECRNLSVESLIWRPPRSSDLDVRALFQEPGPHLQPEWRPQHDRKKLWRTMHQNIEAVSAWLTNNASPDTADELGLSLSATAPDSLERFPDSRRPRFEVTSVRTAQRSRLDGATVTDLVVEIHQTRSGYDKAEVQAEVDDGKRTEPPPADFAFRGGCTLLIDPDPAEPRVRYAITKHILSDGRLARHRAHRRGVRPLAAAAYFTDPAADPERKEPFAMLHGIGG